MLLFGLFEKSIPSEQNDLLNIIKKCIDEREQYLQTISDSEKIPTTFDLINAFFKDERHDTSMRPQNNYLNRNWTLNKVEPLLLHLLRYDCNDKAIKILESKYHTPNQARSPMSKALFLRQIERRFHTAKEQGISHDKLFFPETIDDNPYLSAIPTKGGKKPDKGNVLIIRNGYGDAKYDYSYEEMPKWFPANRYAVSKSDLSVIIFLEYSTRVEAYYSGGKTAVRSLVTVYAINAKEGRIFMESGPIYGSKPETPDKISVASGTVGISGGQPSEVEITKAINIILKGLI